MNPLSLFKTIYTPFQTHLQFGASCSSKHKMSSHKPNANKKAIKTRAMIRDMIDSENDSDDIERSENQSVQQHQQLNQNL